MPILLQIDVSANITSTGRLAEDIGKVAIQNGWESYIAYGRFARPSKSKLIRISSKIEVVFHAVIARLFDAQGYGSYFATKRLISKIRKISPDIVQFHNIHGYYLNFPLLFKFLMEYEIPVNFSHHDCWNITGHCAHFALVKCEKWKTECNNCPIIHEYPESLFFDGSRRNYKSKKEAFTSLRFAANVSGSKWLGSIIENSFLSKYPVYIIPDGIDLSIFKPRSNGVELRKRYNLTNKFVALACGTAWSKAKGLDDYINLSKILPDDCKIVLVGLNDELINNLPNEIIGIKRTNSPEELSELYSMSDCVLSLSYLESFGLTPVEGFACGTPAIVYNCTSTPELITEETGYIAEPGNIYDVRDKIMRLKLKGKLNYSKSCREIAEKLYSKEKCYQQYLDLYNNLITDRNNFLRNHGIQTN